ncbi:hypothetical protein NKH77_35320 [Streptomyces sp. M19]
MGRYGHAEDAARRALSLARMTGTWRARRRASTASVSSTGTWATWTRRWRSRRRRSRRA